MYRGAYYPHNIHFVMVSALMGGDGRTALEAAGKLDKSISPELLKGFPSLQPVKAAPYFSHVQFSSPDTLVALPDPGPDFVLVKAMWHYARAVGFARKGMQAAGASEIAALERLERSADFTPITEWAIPAREIVQTAGGVAGGVVRGPAATAAEADGAAAAATTGPTAGAVPAATTGTGAATGA